MRRMTRGSCWLPTVLLLVGCGGADDPSEAGPATPLTVTRAVEFGDAQGPGALTSVFSVLLAENGGILLTEPTLSRVVEFDGEGAFVRVIGRMGQGPGEFQIPGFLGWRGDSLAVSDFARGISLFDPDLEFVDLFSFLISGPSAGFGFRPMMLLQDGTVAAMAPASPTAITRGQVSHEFWLKTTRDGEVLDTLLALSVAGGAYSAEVAGESFSYGHPFPPDPLLAPVVDGSSFVVVERPVAVDPSGAVYRLLRVGPSGDTLASREVEYSPRPLHGDQVDSLTRHMGESLAERLGATPTAVASALRDQIDWPAYLPPVTETIAGTDGSVWVRREIFAESTARWDVFDDTLEPVGTVALPVDLDVVAVSFDRVYGVELDELDVPTVVRFDVGGG